MKNKKMFWILLVALLILLAWILSSIIKTPKENIKYREHIVDIGSIELIIQSTGYVQPENRLEIKPPIAGRVEQVITKEGEKVKKGTILAWMSSTERAALIDAARARGKEEVAKWEKLYRSTPIIAPIDGTIIQRNVESGQVFASNEYVFVMSDRLAVKANVDETDIAQIKINQEVDIFLDAYPNEPIKGTVVEIAHEAKTINNVTTYVVDVLPNETPDFMRSGMTANLTFYINKKEGILIIPSEAIKIEDNSYYVLVKPFELNKEPEKRIVEIGLSDGLTSEIISGISESEIILMLDISTLQNSTNNSNNPFSPFQNKKKNDKTK